MRLPLQPIQLPLSVPELGGPAALGAAERAVLDGLVVLVVDDDADTRDLAVTVLRRHGCQVVVADSAAAALELVPGVRPTCCWPTWRCRGRTATP